MLLLNLVQVVLSELVLIIDQALRFEDAVVDRNAVSLVGEGVTEHGRDLQERLVDQRLNKEGHQMNKDHLKPDVNLRSGLDTARNLNALSILRPPGPPLHRIGDRYRDADSASDGDHDVVQVHEGREHVRIHIRELEDQESLDLRDEVGLLRDELVERTAQGWGQVDVRDVTGDLSGTYCAR